MTAASGLENVVDAYPLTPMQEGMLFHSMTAPRSGVFMGQFAARLHGTLDVDRFRRAWDVVVSRHAALRTLFMWEGLDDPLQVVRGDVDIDWTIDDWSTVPADAQTRRREEFIERDRLRGFDLGAAPLVRMHLARTAPDAWYWLWSTHHLISDGWSTVVILEELFEIYIALGEDAAGGTESGVAVDAIGQRLPEPVAYRTYVDWHASRDRAADEAFWRDALAGFTEPTRVTPASPPDAADPGHRRLQRSIPASLTTALESFARTHRVTASTVLQGAWALVLSRLARTDDVVFGVTSSGRPAELPGIDRAVGVFINTLPLRVAVDEDQPILDWLQSLQRANLDLRRREHCSLADVQRWSEVPRGESLFESLVVFENYPGRFEVGGAGASADLLLDDVAFIEQSNYPLAVLFMPGPDPRLVMVYDDERLAEASVGRLADQLLRVLEAMATQPTSRLADVDAVDESERRRVLRTWNDTGRDVTSGDLVPARIDAWARRTPDAPALIGVVSSSSSSSSASIVEPDHAVDYAELVARAASIAAELRAAGVGPGDLVGLEVRRGPAAVVGLHGIHRAGAAYVPLDPAYPAEHRRRLADATPLAAIVREPGLDAPVAVDVPVIPCAMGDAATGATAAATGATDNSASMSAAAVPLVPTAASDPAYVIHTSGSTGEPKGVRVPHASLRHSTDARLTVYGESPGRFMLLSSIAFDSSVAGIFWTLATGGTLILPPAHAEQDMRALAATIAEHRVTHLLCLPSLLELMLELGTAADLASLRTVIVAGEACPPGLTRTFRDRLPQARLFNEYGPTEAGVWATAHDLTADGSVLRGGPVPIGRPIDRMRSYVLDGRGRPVPIDVAGELHLAGDGLADGYIGDAARTADRFVNRSIAGRGERLYRTGDLVSWREDGVLQFHGRVDGQVKIRGHRIEPAGVEARLLADPRIEAAVVDAHQTGDRPGDARLVAWIVPARQGANAAPTGDLDPVALQRELRAGWPAALVPDAIVPIDAIPRRPNGKVDRRALPDPEIERGGDAPVLPRDEIETAIAAIWADLLQLESIGVHDDFFALGGDSLVSIRVMSRIEDRFERSLPLATLLERGTVAGLAEVIRGRSLDMPTGNASGSSAAADGGVPNGVASGIRASGTAAPNAPSLAHGETAATNGNTGTATVGTIGDTTIAAAATASAAITGSPAAASPAHGTKQPSGDPTTAASAGPAASAAARHESLVPIRSTGDRTPLFCIHAGGGHVLEYRHLAARVDAHRPVFGLEPLGLDGRATPLDTVEAMATRYVAAVQSVQPRGPYILVGHCVGATICWEMSRQLRAAGHETAALVVIDAGPPVEPESISLPAKVVRFARRHPARFLPYVARRVRHALRDRRVEAARRDVRPETLDPEARRLAHIDAVRQACQKAYWTYRTGPADVPILQIRSSEFANMFGMERHLGWSRLSGGIDVEVVEARHRTMLTAAAEVAQVAEHIDRRLAVLAEDGI
ncbi:MAG: amino acid adenylation domain-containing protein [Phycisphaerales bacterium]